MKFKNTNIVFSLLFLNLKAFSTPLKENESQPNLTNNSDKPENIDILEDEIYDTLPVDNIDIDIKVTDIADVEIESVPVIDSNECTTKECIENSKRILSNLDISVNPCDDFYEFSCGGWIAENNKKPAGYSLYEQIYDNVLVDIGEILNGDYKANENLSPKEREYDEKVFNFMKNLYMACTGKYSVTFNNDENLVNFINKFNITETLAQKDGFTLLIAELHNNGIEVFFDFSKGRTYDDNLPYEFIPQLIENFSESDIDYALLENELSKEGLSLEGGFRNENEYKEYLQKQNNKIDNFKQYVTKVLQTIYSSNINKSRIDKIIESIMKINKIFSQRLIDIYTPKPIYSTEPTEITEFPEPTETTDSEYYENTETPDIKIFEDDPREITNIKTLNEKYPLINWKLYIEKRFKYYGLDIPVNDESIIIEDHYFNDIYKYISKIDIEDYANYFEWIIIKDIIDISEIFNGMFESIISKELHQVRKEYEEYDVYEDHEEIIYSEKKKSIVMKIKKQMEEREEDTDMFKEKDTNTQCISLIDANMPLALSKYYVDRKFTENAKSETMNMMENIRNAMIYRINGLEWLDESTREYAIKKVLNIKYFLGHSDYIMNVENLYNQYKIYDNVHDDPISLFLNLIKVSYWNEYKYIYNDNYEELYESPIVEIIMPSYIVNAFYDPRNNIMNFPAAVLQPPNFDVNQPDYMNYGNIGSTMGHELTHAFDNNGKKYDAEGNEFNWWTDNDNTEFDDFSQCFVYQYDNYTYVLEEDKYNVDGERTLGENLADNGGLDRAFEAWKLSIENNPEKAKERNMLLPGLSNYTIEQLFYISFGQSFCQVGVSDIATVDVHTIGKYRVNGSVSNNKRFAKIFNCPTGTPMNPDSKCELW